jgi:hypothetical protein
VTRDVAVHSDQSAEILFGNVLRFGESPYLTCLE